MWWRAVRDPLPARMFSRALGSAARDLGDGVAQRVETAVEDQRGQQRAVVGRFGRRATRGSTARSTRPLCDSSHVPSVNGADADASMGIPTVAERTAATTQPLRSAGATDANDASPHSGAALRQRGASSSVVEEADAPAVGVHQAVLLPARRIRLHQ